MTPSPRIQRNKKGRTRDNHQISRPTNRGRAPLLEKGCHHASWHWSYFLNCRTPSISQISDCDNIGTTIISKCHLRFWTNCKLTRAKQDWQKNLTTAWAWSSHRLIIFSQRSEQYRSHPLNPTEKTKRHASKITKTKYTSPRRYIKTLVKTLPENTWTTVTTVNNIHCTNGCVNAQKNKQYKCRNI